MCIRDRLLDNQWGGIATDLEIVQTEGFAATKQVDPNMVIKKKGDQEEEVQNGWVGHVIPFELVQTTLLKEDYDALKALSLIHIYSVALDRRVGKISQHRTLFSSYLTSYFRA